MALNALCRRGTDHRFLWSAALAAGPTTQNDRLPHKKSCDIRQQESRRLAARARATPSAARYPLRTAPSMVAGQPERVQSPARNKFGTLAFAAGGRSASVPGAAENVARSSLITCAFSSRASRTREKFGPVRRSASVDDLLARHLVRARATRSPPAADSGPPILLNIHCMVRSSSVACGRSRDGAVEPEVNRR